ncbi:serine/threonine protein kinase [Oscillochloris sp. ZM17-4]|uniref:WD40 repeat domain-containing serine/threonine protein kinase n=1 Tax=Oscillochloris sp. ZM17-4 TaxID=2866714 RepID=UPI001C7334CD|nr:serine/threonine-protein kinase [Oscillochloris sp. ZM17-4]MBX0326509.1 serine/threonine protein kinase [Oscillochloris sp. ZM17-4]
MLAPGTLLQQRYRIAEQVGKGGMGAVYLARDLRLSHDVAIKETFFQDEAYRRAFEHEAKLLARLRHQALAKVSDHFVEGNGQFLVMEFIHGEDLGSQIQRLGKHFASPQALPMVLKWADQLLDVLHYIHTRPIPIIHRDLKPKNLKLTQNFDIILLDFGLARGGVTIAVDSSETTTPDMASRKIYGFTPPYAPIEQMRDGEPDQRSDLYSLGATLYHMLTGTLPADAMSRMARLINGNPDSLRPIRELSPHVPEPVANLIQRSLSVTLEGRPRNAREMREEFFYASHPAATPSMQVRAPGFTTPSALGDPSPAAPAAEQVPVGTLLRMLTTGSPIRSVAFSPSGDLLAAGYDDHTVGIWRISDYSHVRTLKGHTSSVRSVAFARTGGLMASGSDDESVRIWGVADGASRRQLRMPGCSVESIAFSPDGKLLAVGGWGSAITICTVDGDSIRILDTLPVPFVHSLSFSADGALLAAGCYDGAVYLWSTADHQPAGQLSGFASFIYSVAFSPDGAYIAASSQKSVRVWRLSDRKVMETFQGHRGPVRSIAFSPDSQMLASASEDCNVRLWRLSDGTMTAPVLEHRAGVASLAYAPDGRLLATGTHDGRICLWQL